MIKRAMLLLAIAGVYVWVKRNDKPATATPVPREADSQWANEGGANAPAGI